MTKTCNQYKCLRKYKENADSEISKYCGVWTQEQEKTTPNSADCKLYCEKFFCYETKTEITKHEDVNYISTDFDGLNNRFYNGLFAGTSRRGADIREKRKAFENKHENEDTTICPYCDYEFRRYENTCEELDEEENECPNCGKTFILTVEVNYTYSTRKVEKYQETGE